MIEETCYGQSVVEYPQIFLWW